MAILPVNVEKTEKKLEHWYRRNYPNSPSCEHRPTNKSFVTLWQLANTADDVIESLNAAGCGGHSDGEFVGYYVSTVKAQATRLRNLGVPLKELKSVAEIKAEAAVVSIDDLRKIAIAIEKTGKVPK